MAKQRTARRRTREPERIIPPMKIWIWLAIALGLGAMMIGGVFYYDGIKFFRDIEHAEFLLSIGLTFLAYLALMLYIGWGVVAVVGVLVPIAIKSFTGDDEPERDRH